MEISVIMTVFNTNEDWLREAIDSILNQTFKDFELIIVNDGSTNNAEQVINSYSDKRIKYFYQENKGICASRNLGLQNSQGKYVAIMDSDDVSLPNRLEKQYQFLTTHEDFSITTCWIKTFPRDEIVKKSIEQPGILDNINECFFNATAMFKKADFEKYNLKYDENVRTAEDYELWSRACKYLNLYHMPEILYNYRIVGQGITSSLKEERFINTIKIQKRFLDYITYDSNKRKKLIDIAYETQKINKNLTEQIFSIKNLLKFDRKYKVITIFGIEIPILVKVYKVD